jgi:hypothetical protein
LSGFFQAIAVFFFWYPKYEADGDRVKYVAGAGDVRGGLLPSKL